MPMKMSNSRYFRLSEGSDDAEAVETTVEAATVRLFAQREKAIVPTGIGGLAIIGICAFFHQNGIWLALLIALRLALLAHAHYCASRLIRNMDQDRPYSADFAELQRAMILAGVSWGMLTWPIGGMHLNNSAALLVLLTVLTAIGVLVANAAIVPRAMAYVLIGYAPAIGLPLLFAIPQIGPLPLVGALAFVFGMAYYGRRSGAQALSSLRTRVEKEMLAAQLSEANDRLADALAEAERLSQEDSLTGLYNRRAFAPRAIRLSERAGPDEQAFVLLIDLDHFKVINDRFGHEIGDAVLQASADVIASVGGARSVCARWGGEEFLMAMLETGLAKAETRARILREALEVLSHQSWPDELKVSASLGLAAWPRGGSLESVVEEADKAMYYAKETGRNRLCIAPVPDAGHERRANC